MWAVKSHQFPSKSSNDEPEELFDMPSYSTVQMPKNNQISRIGLADMIAVLRTGTDMYKYTSAGGGNRRHSRLFQIKGTEVDEALCWRSAAWISIRKERRVLLRDVVQVNYTLSDLTCLQHPGYTTKERDRCFTIQFLDPSEAGVQGKGKTVLRLHLCAKTEGDFNTWRQGLAALLQQWPPHTHTLLAAPPGTGGNMYDSQNTSHDASHLSDAPDMPHDKRQNSDKSHASSGSEAHTASTVVYGSGEGGGRWEGSRDARHDRLSSAKDWRCEGGARIEDGHGMAQIADLYRSDARFRKGVVKLQAVVRGGRSRAAHREMGDLSESEEEYESNELLRYDMLPDGPEEAGRSAPILLEHKRARDMHGRVERWAKEEEDRLVDLQKRLKALMEASDHAISGNEELEKLCGETDTVTLELQLAAEGLESLSSALVNDHEEAKANARKLHAYCQHVSTVLEPGLGRIDKDVERIRKRSVEQKEELDSILNQVHARPRESEVAAARHARHATRASALTLVLLLAATAYIAFANGTAALLLITTAPGAVSGAWVSAVASAAATTAAAVSALSTAATSLLLLSDEISLAWHGANSPAAAPHAPESVWVGGGVAAAARNATVALLGAGVAALLGTGATPTPTSTARTPSTSTHSTWTLAAQVQQLLDKPLVLVSNWFSLPPAGDTLQLLSPQASSGSSTYAIDSPVRVAEPAEEGALEEEEQEEGGLEQGAHLSTGRHELEGEEREMGVADGGRREVAGGVMGKGAAVSGGHAWSGRSQGAGPKGAGKEEEDTGVGGVVEVGGVDAVEWAAENAGEQEHLGHMSGAPAATVTPHPHPHAAPECKSDCALKSEADKLGAAETAAKTAELGANAKEVSEAVTEASKAEAAADDARAAATAAKLKKDEEVKSHLKKAPLVDLKKTPSVVGVVAFIGALILAIGRGFH